MQNISGHGKILLKETKNLSELLWLNTHIKVEMFYNEINHFYLMIFINLK